MKTKPILDRYLSNEDYELFALAVSNGYQACFETMKSSAVLSEFWPGTYQWSWLIRSFVEYAITNADITDLYHEIKPYAGKNNVYTQFHKNGLVLTSHFLGGGSNKRSDVRKAICRAGLAERNFDLFSYESNLPDSSDSHCYCRILHAGYTRKPETILMAIPTRDQLGKMPPFELPIVDVDVAAVEEIQENMIIRLVSDEQDSTQSAS